MGIRVALKLFLLISLCSLASCNKGKSIPRYDLSGVIDSLSITYKNMDSVINDPKICEAFPMRWDSIAILNPYESLKNLDKFNLTNVKNLDSSISPEYSEDFCILIFIKADTITGYSKVKRVPLDFSTLTPGDTSKFLIGRGDCSAMYLKRIPTSGVSYKVNIRRKNVNLPKIKPVI